MIDECRKLTGASKRVIINYVDALGQVAAKLREIHSGREAKSIAEALESIDTLVNSSECNLEPEELEGIKSRIVKERAVFD